MLRGEKETQAFRDLMLEVLNRPKNVIKGDWSETTWLNLYFDLIKEVKELFAECCQNNVEAGHLTPEQRKLIAYEAADIACFAMFIADKFMTLNIESIEQEVV